jgi:hypothetical protein
MTIEPMHGPHFAKSYVSAYLTADLPGRLVSYRNAWSLDDISLPSPIKYLTHEPIALDEWPTIITTATSMSGLERISHDRGNPLYRVKYSMRTYVWVRTENSPEATIMRDRLTTVVRAALLDYPCLKATDPRGTFRVTIDESSIREEYSDLTLLKGERVLAGSYISYDLEIDEIVMREPIATLNQIDLSVIQKGVTETRSSAITGATKTGKTVVYNAVNNFVTGQKVTIVGINPTSYNMSQVVITARTSNTFTITGIDGAFDAYTGGGVAYAYSTI